MHNLDWVDIWYMKKAVQTGGYEKDYLVYGEK